MTILTVVLVHSPLVGPLTWRPAGEHLRGAGYRVTVPSLTEGLDGGPPYHRKLAGRVAEAIAQSGPTGALVLVGHSGAGALLPAVLEATDLPVAAAVLVDAILPHPGANWFDTAPAALAEQLRGLASHGRLPPWHQWFPPEAVSELLPDQRLRQRFVAELPRVPLAYFEEAAPVVAGWPPGSCGYVQLSAAYEDVAGEAERRGWLVVRQPADHLAMLTRPAMVAGMLDRLVRTLTGVGPDGRMRDRRGDSTAR